MNSVRKKNFIAAQQYRHDLETIAAMQQNVILLINLFSGSLTAHEFL